MILLGAFSKQRDYITSEGLKHVPKYKYQCIYICLSPLSLSLSLSCALSLSLSKDSVSRELRCKSEPRQLYCSTHMRDRFADLHKLRLPAGSPGMGQVG